MAIAQFENGLITKDMMNELVDNINNRVIGLDSNITKTVGTGGDFTTLNSAIDWCRGYYSREYKIILTIKSGTTLSEQIVFKNDDLRFVEIISEDSSVNVDSSSFIVLDSSPDGSYKQFILAFDSFLPLINTSFINDNALNKTTIGIGVVDSKLKISNSKSITFFGYGISALRSEIICTDINLSDNYYYGIRIGGNSRMYCGTITADRIKLTALAIYGNSIISAGGLHFVGNSESGTTGISVEGEISSYSKTISGYSVGVQVFSGVANLYGDGTINGSIYGVQVIGGGIAKLGGVTVNTLSQTANTITANGIIFQ